MDTQWLESEFDLYFALLIEYQRLVRQLMQETLTSKEFNEYQSLNCVFQFYESSSQTVFSFNLFSNRAHHAFSQVAEYKIERFILQEKVCVIRMVNDIAELILDRLPPADEAQSRLHP